MRKETMNRQNITNRRLAQGYHNGNWSSDGRYAFEGFTKNLYFVSDRTIELNDRFQIVGDEEKPLKAFGYEMELSCNSLNNGEQLAQVLENICFQYLPKHLFKYQSDGSLSGRSTIEAITQVMTKEFIRNHYPDFKAMYDYFKMFEIGPNDSCGMHCNMSVGLFGKDTKTRETAIKKFVYFINKHYRLSCALVKRNYDRTNYCSVMNYWTDMNYAKNFDMTSLREGASNHGICFNIAHYPTGRVELRLVGPQKSYYEFRNTTECIFHLIEAMKSLSWEALNDVTKVFKGCNKYVAKRLVDCVGYGLTQNQYDEIISNMDTETDFGNC